MPIHQSVLLAAAAHADRTRARLRKLIARRAGKDIVPGGKADKKPDSAFPRKALAQGVKVEREHTSSPALAREIAKDHMTEFPGYYPELKKMEKRLEKKAGSIKVRRTKLPPMVNAAYEPATKTVHLQPDFNAANPNHRSHRRHELVHAIRHRKGQLTARQFQPGLRNAAGMFREELAAYMTQGRRRGPVVRAFDTLMAVPGAGGSLAFNPTLPLGHRALGVAGIVAPGVAAGLAIRKFREHRAKKRENSKLEKKAGGVQDLGTSMASAALQCLCQRR